MGTYDGPKCGVIAVQLKHAAVWESTTPTTAALYLNISRIKSDLILDNKYQVDLMPE